eukprot:Plantae.Rhodophyta-Purpureofilum_apyrenoidigerum.ctg9487.p1 GENE.Plantae.Rhodophyta-Purpureofilum_apyrenoidigerum.ctg9487~~Plantae.Rhodophyta-Purpureofilum_apyrenoidigerum.ctg9487.p1  ORF type:complete len:620 (+),score=112.15 Plantae.Rhodophyta-Purpureofilum_apyrenoidigerum.ctg9487:84-1862(+)
MSADALKKGVTRQMKYVVVSGGVISGIGKGLTASSLGVLLKSCGYRVTAIKIDPYINIDAGTMSPFEHGEVFVLGDGGEVDLDLGNYERFLDITLPRTSNITTGKVYQQVIERERRGDYLGKTVQVIPHVTDCIQEWIEASANGADDHEICVIELGGTVGDIESMPFVEALRQLKYRVGEENFCSIFVSLVPQLGVVGEQKTKPTQHGVKNLTSMGLGPQIIVCRSEQPLLPETKQKLGLFCQVSPEAVVSVHDVHNTYNIPLMLQSQGVTNQLIKALRLVWRLPSLLEGWSRMAASVEESSQSVTISLVGKYTGLADSYISVVKALEHAGMAVRRKVVVKWVESSALEDVVENGNSAVGNLAIEARKLAWRTLMDSDAVLVPGGFGDRGVEGMILASKYARENKKPYLGICLGMQLAAVEAARSLLHIEDANSEEFQPSTKNKVIIYMPEVDRQNMGGTMRLGARKTLLKHVDCLAAWLYQDTEIWERHRHRYEVNPEFVDRLEAAGLHFVGTDDNHVRMEILERKDHPFFFATQFHPEFLTRPGKPSPPFLGLVMAAAKFELDKASIQSHLKRITLEDPWSQTNRRPRIV